MRSLGYDEGSEPEGMECQEGDDRSHGRTCVTVAATRLLLNVEFTCGNSRQHLFDKTGNPSRVQEGREGGGGGRWRSLVKQSREVLLLFVDSCLIG